MDKIFLKLWELAKPYYYKGRPNDIKHIEWMMKEADRIADIEKLDKSLLMPIVILHDVGYSCVEEEFPHMKGVEIKRIHMREGAKIARELLEKVTYDKKLTEKIVYCISVHDNWIIGDNSPYKECKELAVFNDLDFNWVTVNEEMFNGWAKNVGMTPQEFFEFWAKDEKLTNRPFYCKETKDMFERDMAKIKKAVYGDVS